MCRLAVFVILGLVGVGAGEGAGQEYTPQRINKAIELWEAGQPVYYVQVNTGGYERGLELAQTHADVVGYNFEHAPFDVTELREFVRGLVDGGPTPSGHRTPAIVVTLPVSGIDGVSVRANSWMIEHVLAAGAHGIFLVRTRSPDAVRELVRAARYPQAPSAPGIEEGLRAHGGPAQAAPTWGITPEEYLVRADVWPLNPEGEVILGIKTEDRWALEVIDDLTEVPGIAFVEWGPNDMLMSFGMSRLPDGSYPSAVLDARNRILDSARRHDLIFMEVGTNPDNLVERVDEDGILFHFGNEVTARFGREHTGRVMPY